MSVTVYSKPACYKCNATTRYLDKLQLPYQVIDITQDEEAKKYVESLGYKVMPVVQVADTHWSDFRIELIQQIPDILALKQSA